MNPRLVIDRLELDLRGIDPALARAAVQRLAPALQMRLMPSPPGARPAKTKTDAAAPTAIPAATPDTLAAHLAQQIARRLQGS